MTTCRAHAMRRRWRVVAMTALLVPPPAMAQRATPEADNAVAGLAPRWEVGVAAGVGYVPDYPGAAQNHTRGLVSPFVIYRGRVVRVDREGIRGRLFDNPDFEVDLSASAGFNARNNDARQGMPDLDYLFGIGPQLVYKGLNRQWGRPTLHLKLRAVASTDFRHFQQRGTMADAEARWHFRPKSDGLGALTLSVQPTWASRALQRYFYQVDASQATTARPAYEARAGYLGTELGLTFSRRAGDTLSWFATVRGMTLRGAANTASPLLKDTSTLSVGAGLVWTPWQSAARSP